MSESPPDFPAIASELLTDGFPKEIVADALVKAGAAPAEALRIVAVASAAKSRQLLSDRKPARGQPLLLFLLGGGILTVFGVAIRLGRPNSWMATNLSSVVVGVGIALVFFGWSLRKRRRE